jgi:MoaA/NifB/PqqE/SkfB family radical SAM enzyme
MYKLRRILPIDYLFLCGYSFSPDFVIVIPTFRCNFKCARCAADLYLKKQGNARELSTQEFKKIFDKLARFGPSIYFSGGEPFLREDIFDLIGYVKKKRLVCGIVTNGSLFDGQKALDLVGKRLDFFGVSLDGPEEYHDSARGARGAYANAVQALKAILEAKEKLKSALPLVKITCIIDHENIQNTYSVLKLANELKVDQVDFGYCMFHTAEVRRKQEEFIKATGVGGEAVIGCRIEDDHEFNIDKREITGFFAAAKRTSKVPVSIYDIGMQVDDFYSFKEPSPRSRCLNPWYCAIINPNGDIDPCQNFIIGNLLNGDFSPAWNSEKMKKFRQIRKKQPFPACFRCIEGQRIRFN